MTIRDTPFRHVATPERRLQICLHTDFSFWENSGHKVYSYHYSTGSRTMAVHVITDICRRSCGVHEISHKPQSRSGYYQLRYYRCSCNQARILQYPWMFVPVQAPSSLADIDCLHFQRYSLSTSVRKMTRDVTASIGSILSHGHLEAGVDLGTIPSLANRFCISHSRLSPIFFESRSEHLLKP